MPKKRVDVTQLPALAKRFRAIPERTRPRTGRKAESEGLRFGKEFVAGFFPKRDAWVGRAFYEMWMGRVGVSFLLGRLRKHLFEHGVKTVDEADAIIERKMEQTLKRMDFVIKTLTKQRSKLKQKEVGNTYHAVLGVFQGVKAPCEMILRDLRSVKEGK